MSFSIFGLSKGRVFEPILVSQIDLELRVEVESEALRRVVGELWVEDLSTILLLVVNALLVQKDLVALRFGRLLAVVFVENLRKMVTLAERRLENLFLSPKLKRVQRRRLEVLVLVSRFVDVLQVDHGIIALVQLLAARFERMGYLLRVLGTSFQEMLFKLLDQGYTLVHNMV